MKKKVLAIVLAAVMAFTLCGCCLKHDYAPATCTEPETCTKCGKTQGEALGHTWEEATCEEPKTCAVCGATDGEALGHTWEEATCEEPKTCAVCGATDGEAPGHDWTEATFEEPKTCAVCGATDGKAVKDETAVLIDGKEYTVAQLDFEYMKAYATFLQNYGAYAVYFGFDTSLDPAEQQYSEEETWKDLFVQEAVYNIKMTEAMKAYAEEKGLSVSEEEQTQIAEYIDAYEATLAEQGYEDFDSLMKEIYGPGVTKAMVIEDNVNTMLMQLAYTDKYAELLESITDEELAADPRVDVRHVLLKAAADENGEFTDEALAKAKRRAEAVLRLYNGGELTEEHFAELAGLYSEDPGSADNGGLYEGLAKGTTVEEFDAFCFAEGRQPGDTEIVYGTNGAYAGYHVMYFVGENVEAARTELAEDRLNEWYAGLVTDESFEKGEFYDSIGAGA